MHVYINKYQCNNINLIYNLSKITACLNYWICCIISVFNYYQQPYTILLDFHTILILKDFLFFLKKAHNEERWTFVRQGFWEIILHCITFNNNIDILHNYRNMPIKFISMHIFSAKALLICCIRSISNYKCGKCICRKLWFLH